VSTPGTVGLPLLVLSCLGTTTACLPDPRPYDPCIDRESYYSVSPKGCNGHTVSLLAERTQKLVREIDLPTASEIVVDATSIYWEGPDGEVLRTSKDSQRTDTVWLPDVTSDGLQLESNESHLYIWQSTQSTDDPIPVGSLFVLDKDTLQTETTATAAAGSPPRLQIVDDAAYVNAGGISPCLLQISLVDSTKTCITSGYIERFAVTAKGIYSISSNADGKAIRFLSVGADAPSPVATVRSEVLAFSVYDDRVHWMERDDTGFTLRIADESGELGDGRRVSGTPNSATLSDDQMYVAGWLDQDVSVSRLYDFQAWSATPTIIAAGLPYVTAMTTDDDDLYVSTWSYREDEDGSTARLFRISR
jgi:hypothetical protein